MNKETKLILINQLRIMSALQRIDYIIHLDKIIEDLSSGIKETQRMLEKELLNND